MADETLIPKHRDVKAGGRDTPGVYVIRNTASGRVYVGSSYRIRLRWSGHKRLLRLDKHHYAPLQRSWNKHGEAAFSFNVVEVVWHPDQLYIREQYWIDLMRAADEKLGFNILPRAGGPRGYKFSDAARAKMSASRKGKKKPPMTAAHLSAMSVGRRGRKCSAETCAKMSASKRGKSLSENHRAKLCAILTVRNKTIEMREATSERNRILKRGIGRN